MKWELDALKILARNESVPGIALWDAIGEIEKLRKQLSGKTGELEAMREQNRWIPCAERMPENGDYIVRAIHDRGRTNVCEASIFDGVWREINSCWTVTHWMPLPTFEEVHE